MVWAILMKQSGIQKHKYPQWRKSATKCNYFASYQLLTK